MKPVSSRRRLIYLVASIFAFLLTVPFAVFYASGYRFDEFSLVETGGIYVSVPVSDAVVTINGEEEGTSSLFVRSFYADDLKEGTYSVQVSREGYYPWVKKLTVEPKIVTDVFAFLVPQSLTIREIEVRDGVEESATTTRSVSRAEYTSLLAAFTATSTSVKTDASTSTPLALRAGVGLFIEKGNLIARWTKDPLTVPSSFCEKPSSCVQEFFVEKGKETVTDARFFAGGILYETKESGVFLAENDVRPVPLAVPIYTRPGAKFRVINNELIVKDGKILYDISGF